MKKHDTNPMILPAISKALDLLHLNPIWPISNHLFVIFLPSKGDGKIRFYVDVLMRNVVEYHKRVRSAARINMIGVPFEFPTSNVLSFPFQAHHRTRWSDEELTKEKPSSFRGIIGRANRSCTSQT